MGKIAKTEQLQIRVSPQQKAAIARDAQRAGLTLSDWILSKLLSKDQDHFQHLLETLASAKQASFVLAELNEFLTAFSSAQLKTVIQQAPTVHIADAYIANYVAAMIEQACVLQRVPVPAWLRRIKPLDKPRFVSDLKSIRLHLLRHAPPAFRNRNIFIDSSIGARV